MKHVEPEFGRGSFTCPHCGALTGHSWRDRTEEGTARGVAYKLAQCQSSDCRQYTVWVSRFRRVPNSPGGFASMDEGWTLVWPTALSGPTPTEDMPATVRKTYNEARAVLPHSSRAAGALMRLAIEQLLDELPQKTKGRLNDRIGQLVEGGMPPRIQKALDAVRVIGGDSVHPGVIDTDDPGEVIALFDLVNIIVRDRVTEPNKIDHIFAKLSEGQLAQIDRRDGVRGPDTSEEE